MKIKTPSGGLPQTDNFAVLLVQGLESNDPEILNVRISWEMGTMRSNNLKAGMWGRT